jgi:hypothetical protein
VEQKTLVPQLTWAAKEREREGGGGRLKTFDSGGEREREIIV